MQIGSENIKFLESRQHFGSLTCAFKFGVSIGTSFHPLVSLILEGRRFTRAFKGVYWSAAVLIIFRCILQLYAQLRSKIRRILKGSFSLYYRGSLFVSGDEYLKSLQKNCVENDVMNVRENLRDTHWNGNCSFKYIRSNPRKSHNRSFHLCVIFLCNWRIVKFYNHYTVKKFKVGLNYSLKFLKLSLILVLKWLL